MTAHRIGFLIWPSTKALTLALAEEALRVAQRVHPDVVYELSFYRLNRAATARGNYPASRGPASLKAFRNCFCWRMSHPPRLLRN